MYFSFVFWRYFGLNTVHTHKTHIYFCIYILCIHKNSINKTWKPSWKVAPTTSAQRTRHTVSNSCLLSSQRNVHVTANFSLWCWPSGLIWIQSSWITMPNIYRSLYFCWNSHSSRRKRNPGCWLSPDGATLCFKVHWCRQKEMFRTKQRLSLPKIMQIVSSVFKMWAVKRSGLRGQT